MGNKYLNRLADVIHKTQDVPEAVVGAVNDLLAGARRPWYKALVYKNGEFSKTALFATLANVLVLIAYVLSWFAGAQFTIGSLGTWTIPPFDTGAAAAILAIVNGTYIGNRLASTKEQGNGQ